MADITLLDVSQNGHMDWLEPADEQELYTIIAQSGDRPEELVEVPPWRVKILVRAMNGAQRVLYEANERDPKTGRFKDLRHVYFEIARMCCLHPVTKKPFLKPEKEIEFMSNHNGTIIVVLANKAMQLSGLFQSQQEQARKNSEATQTSTLTTDSASDLATGAE